MTDTTRNDSAAPATPAVAPTPWWLRIALVALAVIAFAVHFRVAQLRSASLLEHDEAISLLAAAGTAQQAVALYDDSWSNAPRARRAAELQAWLHAGEEAGFSDVTRSLKLRDIHPPLYFWLLNAAQRAGVRSETLLRLIGSLVLLAAAVIADRWIWRAASPVGRLLGFALLLLTPVMIETATELRQYSLVALGVTLSLAALTAMPPVRPSRWVRALFIASAPVVLVYSHFGMIVWVAPWAVALAVLTIPTVGPKRRSAYLALMLAALICLPLLLTYLPVLSNRAAATHSVAPGTSIVALRVLSSLGGCVLSLPWRIRTDGLLAALAIAALFGTAWTALRGARAERILLALAIVWPPIWIGLLAVGKLPPHATDAKYLLPGVLAILAIVVRASSRKALIAALGAALLSHLVILPGLMADRKDAALVAELRGAKTLLVDDPKRGYLFPIIAELSPTASVIVARPEELSGSAEHALSLGDPLIRLEVKPTVAAAPSAKATRLDAELRRRYRTVRTLRDGPRRRLTLYRDRVNAPGADEID